MEQTELILLVIKALSYSNQISELTLCDCGGIMFKWREHTFIVKKDLFVEELEGPIRIGSNISILLMELLKVSNKSL